jgi:CelD/BcsL family acetyltransferase involved in cellulose biosynthesis
MVRRAAIIASDIETIDHAFALSASNAAWKAERHAPLGAPYSTEIS